MSARPRTVLLLSLATVAAIGGPLVVRYARQGGPGSYCSRDRDCRSGRCHALSSSVLPGGYCTLACDPSAHCPEPYRCSSLQRPASASRGPRRPTANAVVKASSAKVARVSSSSLRCRSLPYRLPNSADFGAPTVRAKMCVLCATRSQIEAGEQAIHGAPPSRIRISGLTLADVLAQSAAVCLASPAGSYVLARERREGASSAQHLL